MLKNYITIALRNLTSHKKYAFINVFGLSVGLTCCLLLILFVLDEVSYDKQHKRADNLYRIITHLSRETGSQDLAACSPPVAMAMSDEIAEIQKASRLVNPPGATHNLIKYEGEAFYETDGYIADSTIFDLFSFNFIAGNPAKALAAPNTVVITKKIASKLFGDLPALNKIVSITQSGIEIDYKITGVIEELERSHIKANFFISMASNGRLTEFIRTSQEWVGLNFVPSYILLNEGSALETVEMKMNEVLAKYGSGDVKAYGARKRLSLEPVKDIYLKSAIEGSPRIIYVYVVVSIAIFILVIACINFINLSTARAARRANEIGLRKAIGASQSTLIKQIMGESMVIVLISVILSFLLLEFSLPFFNGLTGKAISLQHVGSFSFISILGVLTAMTGILAGGYPAFYLSSLQPVRVLKGKYHFDGPSEHLRKSLVIFQFIVAIALVCGLLVISKQLRFIQEKDLGFDAKAQIVIPLRTAAAKSAYGAMKHEFLQNAFIKKVSGADYLPGLYWNDIILYPQGGQIENGVTHFWNDVDDDFNNTLNIKLLAGRYFTNNLKGEQHKIIINKVSAKALGYTPKQALGQKIKQAIFKDSLGAFIDYEVIGVMEDFHLSSFHDRIAPAFIKLTTTAPWETFNNMILKVDRRNLSAAVASIEKMWKDRIDDTPFEYSFLDQNLERLHSDDRKLAGIVSVFTIIAFVVCCLGLFGLSSYLAERRFKEIGIRKVMGASVNQIMGLMSKEFLKLVLIAFGLAVPLSWYVMAQWLERFAYKTSIDLLVFVHAGAVAVIIALLAVGFHSFRAAIKNPVKALRNE